ncbi:MAG: SDR family NAD(P)-dependent oxidoreductase, partial [Clostridia bacterium]|nr:SDR family NAD(P)-dependent oxidoreductase [Clostridia bacterium]
MVIVITGASSGIGLATGKMLAEKGFTVVGLSRNPKTDAEFEGISCDITNFQAVETAFNEIKEKYGTIDVLINNAGMGIAGAIEHTSAEDLDKQFALNVMALINACKCITPIMRSQGGGKIVNIGSVAGVIPIPFQTAYATTKSAVDMFSMSYGLEVK